jgi:hypothetical protein
VLTHSVGTHLGCQVGKCTLRQNDPVRGRHEHTL